MNRALVCGGRNYSDREAVFQMLDWVMPDTIIEGGARGADNLAREWATARKVSCETFPAQWDQHGRAAGAIRNRQMLTEGSPSLVIAFPGGRGTDNMVEQARKAGLPILDLRSLSVP